MKIRKNLFYLFFLFVVLSCKQNADEVITEQNPEEVAVEITTHSTSVNQTYTLSYDDEEAFKSGNLPSFLTADANESLKIRSAMNTADTIFSFDEIPVIRESLSKTIIYKNGSSESIYEDLTSEEINIMANLTEIPVPDSTRIARTVVKDGFISIYDKSGRLISRESYPEENYTEFLDTLKFYLKMNETTAQSTTSMKIQALRKKLPANVNMEVLDNGHVVYEMNLNQPQGIAGQLKVQSIVKCRTEIDPDLNRTIAFEMFEGSKLIHKKTYQYSENNKLMNVAGNKILGYNPEKIETFSLITNAYGKPAVNHTREFFKQNQTRFLVNL